MIRLPSTLAAITAPLVASNTAFPGIPIGRSLLDGRAFHLSPVLVNDRLLPATNSLALGGLGSGKSTTAKARSRREILGHGHQYVVIDSFGEGASGEWTPLTRSLRGRVIEAGDFTLNPCSTLLPPPVREQLLRSLIVAVEPDALTAQAGHALQHALTHPKATALGGVVDALVSPEDGRWPAATLAEWGVGVAIALSRYTEGSLVGLFDGRDAGLPDTDQPITTFDFTGLDRNSPAIPSLMAAISCWVEHVWLPQSTAPHRHFVLEEAWQILLSPATSKLIQRMLKNSRKAAMSLDVVMHTLSDLGDGPARDLARLCEVAHVGRLGPEEAAAVGALLGLPDWAIAEIPTLAPGQAVWKVGPGYVDIIETVLDAEEAALTDTSSRRRAAQQAHAAEPDTDTETDVHTEQGIAPDASYWDDDTDGIDAEDQEHDRDQEHDQDHGLALLLPDGDDPGEDEWDWEMPPTVIDRRHLDVLQAAQEGRCNEAASLAAIGEREDITAHGIMSDQAVAWLGTRARVADLCGNPDQAVHLRATVARMGKDPDWWANQPPQTEPSGQAWHGAPVPPAVDSGALAEPPTQARPRRVWPYVATVAAAALTAGVIWQGALDDQRREDRKAAAAAYKGRSGAELHLDGVKVDVVAQWNSSGDKVTIELRSYGNRNASYLRIDADGRTVQSTRTADLKYPRTPEIAVPVTDPLADVTVRVAVGGRAWTENTRAHSQEIRLSPTGVAYDAETGDRLPSDL
ncbi:hypothetical protein ACIRTB_21095 [Streptomyces sp. NPDC101158]|uniref:hypothetical protein n=1 Tax=Streptomyces sp. NPDC101158 TaxID=3366117 RepID=UPI0038081B1C